MAEPYGTDRGVSGDGKNSKSQEIGPEVVDSLAPQTFVAKPSDAAKRLDHYLLECMPGFSRSRLQSWIKEGRVAINGTPVASSSFLIRGGESIVVVPAGLVPLKATPEDLPIEVLYQDPSVIAVNKPAGVVVHAGAGNHEGTLVNRLVHHFQTLSEVGGDLRPGIVHRLDKDTSGVILVARTDAAHRALAEQFSSRTVDKTYLALVHGHVRDESGRITKPITRDPIRRTRMTCALETGRSALTEFRVEQRYGDPSPRQSLGKFTLLEVRIGTGRTHQIRVHLSNMGHPVAGDHTYHAPGASSKESAAQTRRMFLHAWRISFDSPATGERIAVESPLPQDLSEWLAGL